MPNRHFALVFTKDTGLTTSNLDPSSHPDLPPFKLTVDEVNVLLGKIDLNKATVNLDSIPPKLLKEVVLSPAYYTNSYLMHL